METPRIQEVIARDLLHQFKNTFGQDSVNVILDSAAAGVLWYVEVQNEVLKCRIQCYEYGAAVGTWKPSMTSNAHVSITPPRQAVQRQGAVYLLEFTKEGKRQARGRTQDSRETENAVRDWVVGGFDLPLMYEKYLFVDAIYRKEREIAKRINIELTLIGAKIRCVFDEGSRHKSSSIWGYAGERLCKLEPEDSDMVYCVLFEKRIPLAIGSNLSLQSAARAILLWMDQNQTTNQVQDAVRNIVPVEFADLFERGEYLAWHWHHVFKQTSNNSVLAFYLPILERIPKSQHVKRFFSFFSGGQLQFSNCSLYPFDVKDLPTLSPSDDPTGERPYLLMSSVERHLLELELQKSTGNLSGIALLKTVGFYCNAQEAIERLEEILSVQTYTPYFGSLTDLLAERMNEQLTALGSKLRAQAIPDHMLLKVQVQTSDGRGFRLTPWGDERVRIKPFSYDSNELNMNLKEAAMKIIADLES